MTGGCDVIDNNSIDKLSINVGIGILSLKRTERKKNKIGGNTCLVVNTHTAFSVERYH